MVCGLWHATPGAAKSSPVGETANFQIDTTGSRTNSAVESGSVTTTVVQDNNLQVAGGPSSYQIKMDLEVDLGILGKKSGSKNLHLPSDYFQDDWIAKLRTTGHYESTQFKADHLGYEDAETLDSHSYKHCDKVKIYDIDQSALSPFAAVASMLLQSDFTDSVPPIKDLVLFVDLHDGVPALRAVRIDLSGSASGMEIKVGLDYVTR